MKPLDYIDAGADDNECTNISMGDLRRWHDEIAELRRALTAMVDCFQPFTLRPIGSEGSAARIEQDYQKSVWINATTVLGNLSHNAIS